MKLYIAEKKEVAQAIADALNGRYQNGVFALANGDKIAWAYGHLMRLADPEDSNLNYQKWNLTDLPLCYPISHIPLNQHQERIENLTNLILQADTVIHAGDPDPEGQRLIDEILEYALALEDHQPQIKRLLINDNNKSAILKALENLEDNAKYHGLSQSALARAVGDQRYGYNLTRAYTLIAQQKGFQDVLSVGRVQTPILGLIVRRDESIENHQKQYYYQISAELNGIKAQYQVQETDPQDDKKRIIDQDFAQNLINRLNGKPAIIESINTESQNIASPLPHNLLSLQAESARLYNYSPKQVLEITQSLRDKHKAITYNRSDCRYLNDERHAEAEELLQALGANEADPQLKSKAFNSNKVSAHHAIIPTLSVPNALTKEEQHVYDLIKTYYIAQFYPARELEKTTAHITIDGLPFIARQSQELSAGWRALINEEDKDEDKQTVDIKTLKQSENYPAKVKSEQKETQPPKRYQFATLLKELASVAKYVKDPKIKALLLDKDADKADEKGGIGTPATRDSHIETLFTRGYIEEKNKQIISTKLGRDLINTLPDFATTPDMTALWHEKQKQIEAGTLSIDALLNEIDQSIAQEIARVKQQGLKIESNAPKCPNCKDGYLRQRKGNKGAFWGCNNYPNCTTTFPDKKGKPDLNAKKTEISNQHLCPECGKGLVRRPSKKDKNKYWWGCSGFSNGCKYTAFDENGKPKEITK